MLRCVVVWRGRYRAQRQDNLKAGDMAVLEAAMGREGAAEIVSSRDALRLLDARVSNSQVHVGRRAC